MPVKKETHNSFFSEFLISISKTCIFLHFLYFNISLINDLVVSFHKGNTFLEMHPSVLTATQKP